MVSRHVIHASVPKLLGDEKKLAYLRFDTHSNTRSWGNQLQTELSYERELPFAGRRKPATRMRQARFWTDAGAERFRS